MLNGTTINDIKPATLVSSEPITLGAVLDELQTWRHQKPNRNTAIPDVLWNKIFSLTSTLPHSTIKKTLGIVNTQYDKKFKELHGPNTSPKKTPVISAETASTTQAHSTILPNDVQFHELKTTESLFKPDDTLQKHTIIVEFHRSDGQLMKIHAIHSDFKTIMELFFGAEHHVSYHPAT